MELEKGTTTIKTYPNTSSNLVNIESTYVINELKVCSSTGVLVNTIPVNSLTGSFEVTDLPVGKYLIHILMDEGKTIQEVEIQR